LAVFSSISFSKRFRRKKLSRQCVIQRRRRPAKRGVNVRLADYDKPATPGPAFAGTKRLLMISASEPGKRVRQHRAVIDAAGGAGVKLVAYTSLPHSDTSPLGLTREHHETEAALRASAFRSLFMRDDAAGTG